MSADPNAATLAEGGEAPSHDAARSSGGGRVVLGERYELLGLLGSGGMGNVYKARDLELDELVAVKVLRPELVGAAGALERFRREVKLARRVTHPNGARVFDIGEHGHERIISMELIDGEPLSAVLDREGALPAARIVELATAICSGVAAAHASGVVHRDLKPENVMVARSGRLLVSDFGIACAAAATEAARTQGIIGTPAYMAPEQVEGSGSVDERADVYALGVMLFEMLTGAQPWQGTTVIAIAAARLLRPPPDPRSVRPSVSPELAEITLRCMARDPAQRFASMDAVSAALRSVALPAAFAASTQPLPPLVGSASSADRRVAVLPFRNQGPAGDAYVADGVTEDLIDRLSVARGLRVQSRGVVMPYAKLERDPRDVGRELGVEVVVEGTVRKAPGRYRISARVISVTDGFQLWAKQFDTDEADLFATSDRVARAVANALTVDLDVDERAGPADAEAVDLYLRARAAYHRFFSGDPRATIELFEKAMERAPDDPRIVAGWVMSRSRSPTTPASDADELVRQAERALRLAPSLPDGHVALASVLFHFGREPEAVRAARRALRIAPNSAEALDVLGRILCETDHDDGGRFLETVLVLEPSFEFTRTALSRFHALRGDWDRALATFEGTVDTAVQARMALWQRDRELAGRLLDGLDPPDLGRPVQRLVRTMLEVTVSGTAPAESAFPPIRDLKPRVHGFVSQIRTELACAIGDRAGGIAWLEECANHGVFDVAWLDHCPPLELLRPDPAFADVRARVAARAARVTDAYVAPLGPG